MAQQQPPPTDIADPPLTFTLSWTMTPGTQNDYEFFLRLFVSDSCTPYYQWPNSVNSAYYYPVADLSTWTTSYQYQHLFGWTRGIGLGDRNNGYAVYLSQSSHAPSYNFVGGFDNNYGNPAPGLNVYFSFRLVVCRKGGTLPIKGTSPSTGYSAIMTPFGGAPTFLPIYYTAPTYTQSGMGTCHP
jgi:hypothetical protein